MPPANGPGHDVIVVDAETALRRPSELVEALAPGGYVYILASRRSGRAAQECIRSGLVEISESVELPPAAPRILLPSARRSLQWASDAGLIFRGRRATLALRALGLAPSLFGTLARSGTLLGEPSATPPGEDIAALLSDGAAIGPLSIPLPSATRGRIVALALERDSPIVISVGVGKGIDSVGQEKRALLAIAPRAGAAGADVPRVLASCEAEGAHTLVQSMVPGHLAATAVFRAPSRLGEITEAVADWVGSWQGRDGVASPLADDVVEREFLAPCDRLAERLAPEYRPWIEGLVREARAGSVTLADSHGDLTMANVSLNSNGIGVIDWVSATPGRIALQDLVYACCDAVAALGGYGNRLAAFESSFRPAGRHARVIAGVVGRGAAHVSPATRRLAFHACWLRHAVEEIEGGAADGPFSKMAAAVSRDPDGYAA